MRFVPMQLLFRNGLACLALVWMTPAPAMAQGGGAAPEVQNTPRPAPQPYFIPSRPPPPKSEAAPEESEQGKDVPQEGSGCRYQDRKLELIV